MIVGVGVDMVDSRRIAKSLDRFGDRFINRIFTDAEQQAADNRGDRTLYFAKRFAAKEAIYTLGLLQMAPPRSAKDLLHSLDLLQRSARRVYLPTLNPLSLVNKLPKSKVFS